MKEVLQLTWAYLRHHPARMILTALATVAASCMVVWVVSGYDAMLVQFAQYSEKALGRYQLTIVPISTFRQVAPGAIPYAAEKYVPWEVVDSLRADPAVFCADPMWSQRAAVRPYDPATFRMTFPVRPATRPATPTRNAAAGEVRGKRPVTSVEQQKTEAATQPLRPARGGVMMLGTDAAYPPYPLLRGRWISARTPDVQEACLSADAAARLEVDVGGDVVAGLGEQSKKLRVIGIVDTPQVSGAGARAAEQTRGPSNGGLYVPMQLASKILNRPAQISFIAVQVKPEFDINQFRFGWAPRLNSLSTPSQFQDAHGIEEELDVSATADNVRMQAYGATGISLLAALFIIFTTLSMGVSERARQFAILRAVALTRLHIAMLIAVESLVMAVIGWVGGLVAGQTLLSIAARAHPKLLGDGAVLGSTSIMLSAACAFGGAALAAIVPMFRATRVRPVDAMSVSAHKTNRGGLLIGSILIGLMLICINPILTYVFPLSERNAYMIYILLGCSTMGLGFVFLAPAAVMMTETLFAPILAFVFRLDRHLLASQLSSNLWRTVGTAIAMTIGLGLFVGVQVWGYTMLGSFVPGSWTPDAILSFNPLGLYKSEVKEVAKFPGVISDSVMALAVEQPRLTDDPTHSGQRATVTRQDSIVLMGLDPERAFSGEHPLIKVVWEGGNPRDAAQLLKQGRYCIVPNHFLTETGFKIGDSFRITPPDDSEHPVSYTIAGSVSLPGWHWFTKPTGFRSRTHRAAALIFADFDIVKKDFDLPGAQYVWANIDPAKTDKEHLSIESQDLYSELLDQDVAIAQRAKQIGYNVRVWMTEDTRRIVRHHADGWIWAMGQLPLVTLTVASIGVLNAILASVRARRWEMGVLRAVGFTRWTLIRLVIAEGILIGLTACLLSLGFGIMAGWCGAGISQYVSFFGGLHPTLTIPWDKIQIGLYATLGLCTLAALWPAISTGRTDILRLLQAGRSST